MCEKLLIPTGTSKGFIWKEELKLAKIVVDLEPLFEESVLCLGDFVAHTPADWLMQKLGGT